MLTMFSGPARQVLLLMLRAVRGPRTRGSGWGVGLGGQAQGSGWGLAGLGSWARGSGWGLKALRRTQKEN